MYFEQIVCDPSTELEIKSIQKSKFGKKNSVKTVSEEVISSTQTSVSTMIC